MFLTILNYWTYLTVLCVCFSLFYDSEQSTQRSCTIWRSRQTTTRGFSMITWVEKYECRKKKKIWFLWKSRPPGQTSEEAPAAVWGITSSRRTVMSLSKNNKSTERSKIIRSSRSKIISDWDIWKMGKTFNRSFLNRWINSPIHRTSGSLVTGRCKNVNDNPLCTTG